MLKKLLYTFALLYAAAGWGAALPDFGPLAREADEYAEKLRPKGNQHTREEAAILLDAARIMKQAKGCASGRDLVEQALRQGAEPVFGVWSLLGQTAVCENNWELASRAFYNAVRRARSESQRVRGLALLGETLERRSSWRHDWNAQALSVYRLVLEKRDVDWIRDRVRSMEQKVEAAARLEVTGHEIRPGANGAAICLRFSHDMPDSRALRYGDYIRFEPAFDTVFERSGHTVCADGAAFRSDYRVRVLPGLQSAQRRLRQEVVLDIRTGDREPALWFDSSAYILPASEHLAVPLRAVNVKQLELTLLRIHPGNFLDDLVRDRFRKQLSEYAFRRIAEQEGEQVWQARRSLAFEPNRQQVHAIELDPAQVSEPGLYVLRAKHLAGEDEADAGDSTQWLVVSDIGLTTYQGTDGLTVVARSLSKGTLLKDLELQLYARNNAVLATTRTDQQGVARISPGLLRGQGGRTPVSLAARHPAYGFSLLPLTSPGFDLSDRGVGGRSLPGALDAYVYTDRGVYRPGELVHAVGLLRDRRGGAAPAMPLTLVLEDSGGDTVSQRLLQPGEAADYLADLRISPSARTGRWTLALYAERDAKPVGEVQFLVEDIVPPRIEASLQAQAQVGRPGDTASLALRADYLFGAPAAGLQVQGDVFIEADPAPFPDYPEYRFGRVEQQAGSDSFPLRETRTDDQGRAVLTVTLPEPGNRGVFHRARVRAEVLDVDGRAVAAQASLPIRPRDLAVGIQPLFADGRIASGAEAGFQVLALNRDGSPRQHQPLTWRLIHEQRDYQWYQRDGEWHFEAVIREHLLRRGELVTAESGLAPLSLSARDGRFRLEINDPVKQGGLGSSIRFQVGESLSAGSAERPDALVLSSDKTAYAAGDSALLSVRAPFAGYGTLVLAGDRVQQVRHFELPRAGAELRIPMDSAWGAGVYALVSAFRPGAEAGDGAGRAVGVVWLGLNRADRRLQVALDVAATGRPRSTLKVPLTVQGAAPGEAVFVSLAAVDEGVLGLTGFASPSPFAHFFGKRRLGVQLRDAYGRLIKMPAGAAPTRQGAGASGRRGMPEKNVEITALFSGRVKVDAHGRAEVALPLADFAGRLRLMAVAWSRAKSGAAEARITINDPVTMQTSLPRFLALGDTGTLTVALSNLSGPQGEYRISVEAEGDLLSVDSATQAPFALGREQRQTLRIPITAHALGVGWLRLKLHGPQDYTADKRLRVGIRGRYLPETRRRFVRLAAGAALHPPAGLLDDLDASSVQLTVTAASAVNMDVAGLLRQLQLYPYGCLEQLTSRALPLLFHDQLASEWQLPRETGLQARIRSAAGRLLEKQREDGSFGLWSDQDRQEPWLSAYAMEFLVRARAAGSEVPEYALGKGLDWLLGQVSGAPAEAGAQGLSAQAYAHFVLALAGQGRPEDARYLLDTRGDALPSPMASAHLGATFALLGDVQRARLAFQRALEPFERTETLHDYGSALRDLAAAISLANEYAGSLVDPADALQRLSELFGQASWLSTQEQAWLVMAARGLSSGGELALEVPGETEYRRGDTALIQRRGAAALQGKYCINRGAEPVWITMTADGTPLRQGRMEDQGMRVTRRFHTLDGAPANLAGLRQGDMLVAIIRGKALNALDHRALVVDALPAGLEIDNPNLLQSRTLDDLHWLPELSVTRHVEALDDRFVAALDLDRENADFAVAYLLRAVTPGHYGVPPVTLEDMYKPQYRARGQAAELSVSTRD